jgi:hypothetical protein
MTETPMPTEATVADRGSAGPGGSDCWCCGQRYPSERLIRLGSHPEVAVCSACAHFLHQRARQREDALRPSTAGRLRDGLRWGRQVVIERQWHQRPVIGRPLRWLGRHLP